MPFPIRHINRKMLPTKHIVVCEDHLAHQHAIALQLAQILDPEGPVQVSFVPGAHMAAAIIDNVKVDLIILDHDMPNGNGTDLLNWLIAREGATKIKTPPIITASGIPQNNQHMAGILPAAHVMTKDDIMNGRADALIHQLLGVV
jgi:CheY-like chemotaxis protein